MRRAVQTGQSRRVKGDGGEKRVLSVQINLRFQRKRIAKARKAYESDSIGPKVGQLLSLRGQKPALMLS